MRTHMFTEKLYEKKGYIGRQRNKFLARQKAILNGTPGELDVKQFRERVRQIRKNQSQELSP